MNSDQRARMASLRSIIQRNVPLSPEAAKWLLAELEAALADRERLDWLIFELNELYSNCTRDVFGMSSDEEGEISREFIDQQRDAAKEAK